MKITSSAFVEGESIPRQFTRDGQDKSPPLSIEDVPSGAKSLVLIVNDPDAPSGTFTHWILFNMSPSTAEIHEDAPPVMATQGRNDWGNVGYNGPQPPAGEHRYFFKLYALKTVLSLSRGAKLAEVQKAMEGHILEEAVLMARYEAGQLVGGR